MRVQIQSTQEGPSRPSEGIEVAVLADSNSRLTKLYASKEFRRLWDNDISFHVARNLIHLRRFRGISQADIAKAMGTSQSAVARIEGGDENITLRTLQRLALALRGRIRFAIEPQEEPLPQWPAWWQMVGTGINATSDWRLRGVEARNSGSEVQLVAGWSAQGMVSNDNTLPDPELLSLAQAS